MKGRWELHSTGQRADFGWLCSASQEAESSFLHICMQPNDGGLFTLSDCRIAHPRPAFLSKIPFYNTGDCLRRHFDCIFMKKRNDPDCRPTPRVITWASLRPSILNCPSCSAGWTRVPDVKHRSDPESEIEHCRWHCFPRTAKLKTPFVCLFLLLKIHQTSVQLQRACSKLGDGNPRGWEPGIYSCSKKRNGAGRFRQEAELAGCSMNIIFMDRCFHLKYLILHEQEA